MENVKKALVSDTTLMNVVLWHIWSSSVENITTLSVLLSLLTMHRRIFQLKSRGNSFRESIFLPFRLSLERMWMVGKFSFFQKKNWRDWSLFSNEIPEELSAQRKCSVKKSGEKEKKYQFQQNWTANSPVIVFEQSNFIVSPLFQLPFPIFIMFLMLLTFKRIFFVGTLFLCSLILQSIYYYKAIVCECSVINSQKWKGQPGRAAGKLQGRFSLLFYRGWRIFHSLFACSIRGNCWMPKSYFFWRN